MTKRVRVLALALLVGLLLLAACGGAAPGEGSGVAAPAGSTAVDIGTGPIQPTTADGPASRGAAATTKDVAGVCLSPQEAELARLVNEYRATKGLPAIPVSKSLTLVAQQHGWDLNNNALPAAPAGKECNLHSWSANVNPALQEGTWSEVCYTSDHANAAGMWNKPREIAGFQSDAVENSFWASNGATPAGALLGWQNSPGHNAVITEQNGWGPFLALGVAIVGNHANMWVAPAADPAGVPAVCAGAAAPTAVPAPTDVPPTAIPAPTDVPPTAVPAPTDVPPTAVPAATDVPPTAVPAATDVPPTAVPAPATGELLNTTGTVAAGERTSHTFPVVAGGSYTVRILPNADFDSEPAYSCAMGGASRSGTFDSGFAGEEESTSFSTSGDGTCTVTVGGYNGSSGGYTIVVTAP